MNMATSCSTSCINDYLVVRYVQEPGTPQSPLLSDQKTHNNPKKKFSLLVHSSMKHIQSGEREKKRSTEKYHSLLRQKEKRQSLREEKRREEKVHLIKESKLLIGHTTHEDIAKYRYTSCFVVRDRRGVLRGYREWV